MDEKQKQAGPKSSVARERLAANVSLLRSQRGKNIRQAALEIGIAYSYMYGIEHPAIGKNPSMEMLDRLAAYFKVDVSKLFL